VLGGALEVAGGLASGFVSPGKTLSHTNRHVCLLCRFSLQPSKKSRIIVRFWQHTCNISAMFGSSSRYSTGRTSGGCSSLVLFRREDPAESNGTSVSSDLRVPFLVFIVDMLALSAEGPVPPPWKLR
jgi:hypothetical protein